VALWSKSHGVTRHQEDKDMTPQTAPYVRRNVWTLPSGDQTIVEYAKAVTIMKARDSSDPTSWSYQAAIHGTHAAQTKPLWNGCQHGTWFFVAWHRMFIYYFEQIVRAAVVQAGVSSDWALPFWDYGAGGQQATIPLAFRDPEVNGSPNPLYVSQRAQGINSGLALPPAVASPARALSRPKFTGMAQFGGGITSVQQFSSSTGQLEQTPHNDVHGLVGGQGGWMNDPDQAAEDPIFWLHHANIDRIWFVWSGPTHEDPADQRWTGQKFSFFDAEGNQVQKTCADVVDNAQEFGYTYEPASEHAALAATPTGPRGKEPAMMTPGGSEEEREPELVGASDASVRLAGGPATVALQIDAKAKEAVLADTGVTEPTHIYLSVEDIDAQRNPGTVYGIYVNLPEDASPESAESHHAGNVSFFGVERARNPRGDEHAHGLRVTHEITELAHALATHGEWDGQHVNITFRPLGLIPADRPELAHALPDTVSSADPPVVIGRVSVWYG
jgi:tyrosinase